jgi:acyl dehydratase
LNLRSVPALSLDALRQRIGQEIGVSDWRVVDQRMIDGFADVTGDRQFIHVDPQRAAAEAPFGGTIAHGFLTLSLLSVMGQEALPPVAGRTMGINYGFDRIRFLSPVRCGARVRGRFSLVDVNSRSPHEIAFHYRVTVEIEGETKPALSAEWLTLAVVG